MAKCEFKNFQESAQSSTYDYDVEKRYIKKGRCIIFNHENFSPSTGCTKRETAAIDKNHLQEIFNFLDFEIIVYKDFNKKQIFHKLKKESSNKHSGIDCFVCIICTHGGLGMLSAYDKKYYIREFLECFDKNIHSSLVDVPKLFFIQACRGPKGDKGVEIGFLKAREEDLMPQFEYIYSSDLVDIHFWKPISKAIQKIFFQKNPQSYVTNQFYEYLSHSNYLIVNSTYQGYVSFKNGVIGSWFIFVLCHVLYYYSKTDHLLDMMTILTRNVAIDCVSNMDIKETDKCKQVPIFTSTLTRQYYFSPKKF